MLIFATPCRSDTITVSAAISLKESLEQIALGYESQSGNHVVFNFDASGKLAAQIRQGAPVDLFISADNQQMDLLIAAKMVDPSARRLVVQNTLVLIAPADAKNPPHSFGELAENRGEKVAIGEPKTVPAGRYAMQTLKALKLDQTLAPRLVFGESVRAVLTYVERGEVYAGIVYGTDARQAGDKVRVVATAPASTHQPIEYPGAVISGAAHADAAKSFLDYLSTEPARRIFQDHGFSIPATTIEFAKSPLTLSPAEKPPLLPPLLFSLLISITAVLLVALVGISSSSFTASHRFRGKSIIEAILILPLVLPPTVVGYFLIVLFGAHGIIPGYSIVFRPVGGVLAAAVVSFPLLYLPSKAAFRAVDPDLQATARLMGANTLQVFWHISLPLALPGILSGLLLAFARAIGEFGATTLVLGNSQNHQTLPMFIYNLTITGDLRNAAGAVWTLSLIALLILVIYNRFPLPSRN
jgi:molybdate transport system substrate-binding protein